MSLKRFFRRSHWDDERARELEAHLAIETDENIARGMSPERARLAARRKLGNRTLVREEIYQMNTIGLVDTMWQDLKYGARLLRLNPGFAAVAILSLALGIGANTAIFQLIDAVRLRTLPVTNPHEIALVRVKTLTGARGGFGSWYPAVTNPIWERIRDDGEHPLAEVFAWQPTSFDLSDTGQSRMTAGGLWVSGEYFNALGVRPVLGRVFAAADDRRGCTPTAVISHAFWQREFGGDRAIVGKTLLLDRHRIEIVGVAEQTFLGLEVGSSFDVAVPICGEALLSGPNSTLDNGTIWWLTVMARLKPGVAIETVSAQLASVSAAIFDTVPPNYPPEGAATYKTFSLIAEPAGHGLSRLRTQYADSLWILLALAGVVLLIAAANLANLMLARGSAREREIAVRLAIGASRGRVVRQLLAESALLAAIGASLGAALAGALSRALIASLGSDASPVVLPVALDWRVFAFTASVAVVCATLFGLAPALRTTCVPAGVALRGLARGLTADRHRFTVRRVLVVSQLALSLALVVCAFQFVATFRALASVDTGFRQSGIVEAGVDFRRLALPVDRRASFRLEVLSRIRAIHGVEAASDASVLPLSGASWSNAVWMDGSQRNPDQVSKFNWVGAGYFRTLGIPLLAGRDFDERRDSPASATVAIVNETFARRFVGSGHPIGQRFWVERTPTAPETRYEVIGLVKDTKYQQLRSDSPPIAYLTTLQQTTPPSWTQILVRTSRPSADVTSSIERALVGLHPDVAIAFRILETRIRQSLRREQLMAALSGFFGVLAALLATVGLYGVLSYTVARRRNEIGIRMALGASRRNVVAIVVREATALVAVGIAAGAMLALAAARTASSILFGVTPADPFSFAMAVVCFGTIAAVAVFLPAFRASRLEPTIALREE